jgi:Ankyrin repeats (3 copies)
MKKRATHGRRQHLYKKYLLQCILSLANESVPVVLFLCVCLVCPTSFLFFVLHAKNTQADLTVEQRELLYAANNGNIAVLQRIATRDNIRFKYGDDSLLHYAAYNGHYSCVEFLLEMGISASVKDSQDYAPLHHCTCHALTPDRAEIIKLLVANGASLEDKCKLDNTPLHQACAKGCVAMVEFLLSQRANKSATTTGGNTPLHIAANKNKVDIARKLLDNGADLFACNNNGQTPVDVAADQTVVNALLMHKLAIVSRENAQLRQEVHDLKNLTLATALFGSSSEDRVVDSTTSATTTANRSMDPIQQQQQQQLQDQVQVVDINNTDSGGSYNSGF